VSLAMAFFMNTSLLQKVKSGLSPTAALRPGEG
jgi:hypothetical protein